MHSSLLPRPLQPCLYPSLILPSVEQEPTATLSLLGVPHCCPTLFVCISLNHCQSFPFSLHHSVFMFPNCSNEKGESSADLGLGEECIQVCMHACAVIVHLEGIQLTCYLMGINICCQIKFSPSLYLFFFLPRVPFFHNDVENVKRECKRCQEYPTKICLQPH